MAIRFDEGQLARREPIQTVTSVNVTRNKRNITPEERISALEADVAELKTLLAAKLGADKSRAGYMREYRKIRAAEKGVNHVQKSNR